MRTIVIGDIHGALKSLESVLKRCRYDPKRDKLIFLGDYVDGWGETAELIDYLIKLKSENDNIVFIKGNHDVWCQDWLNKGWTPLIWTQQGGQATIDSYIRTGLLLEQSHRDFFNNLEDWYIDDKNRLFLHAGWDYRSAPFPEGASYPVNAGSTAKECHWDRSLLAGAASASHGGRDYDAVFNATKGFYGVYIGHSATKNHRPIKLCNLWNVDSGCGWYGKLTALDIDTEDWWQSDNTNRYYPNEPGRGGKKFKNKH